MSSNGVLVAWPPSEVPVQNPDPRNRLDPKYLAYFHGEFCPDVAKNGILVPLIVSTNGGVKTLLDGETRRRAALEAGLKEVPVLELKGEVAPEDLGIIKYRLNKKRLGLSLIEETRFLHSTMQAKGWSQSRLCRELDLDPSVVCRQFKVLDLICDPLKDKIGDGRGLLSLRSAYAIRKLPPDQQQEWATKILNDVMSIQDVEKALRKGNSRQQRSKPQRLRDGDLTIICPSDWAGPRITEAVTAIVKKLRRVSESVT